VQQIDRAYQRSAGSEHVPEFLQVPTLIKVLQVDGKYHIAAGRQHIPGFCR